MSFWHIKNLLYYFTPSFYNISFITLFSFILNKNHNKRGKKKKNSKSSTKSHHTQHSPPPPYPITANNHNKNKNKTEGDQNKISPWQRPHWWGWTPRRGRTHDGRSQWQRPRRRKKKKDREGEWQGKKKIEKA